VFRGERKIVLIIKKMAKTGGSLHREPPVSLKERTLKSEY